MKPPRTKKGTKRGAQKRRRANRLRQTVERPIVAVPAELEEIESVRAHLDKLKEHAGPPRWNADPEDVRRSVVKLVLTLVELIRQLLERQAIRRMEADTLTAQQTEAVGLALMRLEETVRDLALEFDLDPGELNLDLGPVGKLL